MYREFISDEHIKHASAVSCALDDLNKSERLEAIIEYLLLEYDIPENVLNDLRECSHIFHIMAQEQLYTALYDY